MCGSFESILNRDIRQERAVAVTRLRQVYLVAADFAAEVSFLKDVVGLALQFQDGERWAQFSTGDGSIAVASREESLGAVSGSQVPVLAVNDLDQQLLALRGRGARLGEVRDMGEHGRTVLVQSPGGTTLALFQK